MNEITLILFGIALGAIPTRKISDIMVAFMSKKLGIKPKDIIAYDNATNDQNDNGNSE